MTITSYAHNTSMSVNTLYEVTKINNVTRIYTYIHTLHIAGICPRTNMSTTLQIYIPHYYCSLHTDFTDKLKKTNCNFNYHAIVIYVPATNMSLSCHICPNYSMCINGYICQYTALLYIYFTLLAYAPEQICLLHGTYMSHCTSSVGYILSPTLLNKLLKNQQCSISLPYYCEICATKKYAPPLPHVCHIPKLLNVPQ